MKFEEIIFGLRNAKEFPEHYEEVSELAIDLLERTRWIPVSERLPTKEDGDVLAYYEDGTIWSANWSDVVKFSDPKFNNLIVDWMPLPEAPKEVE